MPKMQSSIIEISALLGDGEYTHPKALLLQSIVKNVYEHRTILKKGIIDCDVNPHNFAVITLNLKKIPRKLQKSLSLDRIFDGTFRIHTCTFCGCSYLSTWISYTYRDSGGCIGRSYECMFCRNIKRKYLCQIYNVFRKKGAKAAKQFQTNLVNQARLKENML